MSNQEIVRGMPKLGGVAPKVCGGCQKGKQTRSNHNSVKFNRTKPLELLHMDLAGPYRTQSLAGKYYFMIVVDDFSQFSWIAFLREKSEALREFTKLCRLLENEKNVWIVAVKSDHGGEFESGLFADFCDEIGVMHNFSAPFTPQHNGVAERKNRNVKEMVRTMIRGVPRSLWAEAASTAVYIINRVNLRLGTHMTS